MLSQLPRVYSTDPPRGALAGHAPSLTRSLAGLTRASVNAKRPGPDVAVSVHAYQ